jgi:hypothetical protein
VNRTLAKLWHDPVWSKVISGAILAGAAAVVAYLLDWWPAIRRVVELGYEFIVSRTATPNWLLGALVLLTVPTVIILAAMLWARVFPSRSSPASWTGYTTDLFFGLRWRWRYLDGGLPYDLHTFCPNCDFQVYAHNASPYSAVDRIGFHCDSCGRDLGEFEEPLASVESKAQRFIQQKLRNGTWRNQAGA